jgi:hypothetical protein
MVANKKIKRNPLHSRLVLTNHPGQTLMTRTIRPQPALKHAQRPNSDRRLFCRRVLFLWREVEHEVGFDERAGGDVEDGDFLVCVAGKVVEFDLATEAKPIQRFLVIQGR